MKLLYQNHRSPSKLTANKIVRLIFVVSKPASNFEKALMVLSLTVF